MGRRKIEIKPIKDDRNRSVTFLKRKGGLFKKAHELSVLCSVDVAVIIFGHNKKLYEFSSGNIRETLQRYQYYGPPHEHKGPADFAGKREVEEDDDEVSDASKGGPQMPQVPGVPHISPALQSVQFSRQSTPQSRPVSRTRVASMPTPQLRSKDMSDEHQYLYRAPAIGQPEQQQPVHQPQHPQQQQQHPQFYQSSYLAPHMQVPQMPRSSIAPQPETPQPQAQSNPFEPPMSHPYMPEQARRAMMPPSTSYSHDRQLSIDNADVDTQQQMNMNQDPSIPSSTGISASMSAAMPTQPSMSVRPPSPMQTSMQTVSQAFAPTNTPALGTKSRSVFTPIDDNTSILAHDFGLIERSPGRSVSNKPASHNSELSSETSARSASTSAIPQRTQSLPVPPPNFVPPSTGQPSQVSTQPSCEVKRPKLKVQIPGESPASVASADEKDDEEPQGQNLVNTGVGRGVKNPVVLPPPSSDTNSNANNSPSAGAQGPPNPFAKLPPLTPGATTGGPPSTTTAPNSNSQNGGNNNVETPLAVLPSRFISDALLPSPSTLYPELNFGRLLAGNGTSGNTPTSAVAPTSAAVVSSSAATPSAMTSGTVAPSTGATTDRLVAMGIGIGVGLGMGMNNNGGGDMVPSPNAWGASTGQPPHGEAGNTQGRVAEENDEKENIAVANGRGGVATDKGDEVDRFPDAGGKATEGIQQGETNMPRDQGFTSKRPRDREIEQDPASLAKRAKVE